MTYSLCMPVLLSIGVTIKSVSKVNNCLLSLLG